MDKERFDKMEDMLSKVIYMVGSLKEGQERMENRLDKLENRLDRLEQNQDQLQKDHQAMRAEIMEKISEMHGDQNFIWEKGVRNERELAKIKAYLQI